MKPNIRRNKIREFIANRDYDSIIDMANDKIINSRDIHVALLSIVSRDRIYDPDKIHKYDQNMKSAEPTMKNYKISLCTHCMNRIEEAKITIPMNLNYNEDYDNFELVVLDYGSSDGFSDWIRSNFMSYIKNGRLTFCSMDNVKYFDLCHSKNIVMKCATGDIINSIDIDMVCDYGFASHINDMANMANQFGNLNNKLIFAKDKPNLNSRLGFFKEDFIELGGYNEDFFGYGFEDRDLFYRSLLSGFILVRYTNFHKHFGGIHYSKDITRYINYHPDAKDYGMCILLNILKSVKSLIENDFIANTNKHWGKAEVLINFDRRVKI